MALPPLPPPPSTSYLRDVPALLRYYYHRSTDPKFWGVERGRKAAGVNMLAERSGVEGKKLRRILIHEGTPSNVEADAILRALGIQLKDLILTAAEDYVRSGPAVEKVTGLIQDLDLDLTRLAGGQHDFEVVLGRLILNLQELAAVLDISVYPESIGVHDPLAAVVGFQLMTGSGVKSRKTCGLCGKSGYKGYELVHGIDVCPKCGPWVERSQYYEGSD